MERMYKRTLYASYIGYITQAIVVNLAPLLFVMFQQEFQISLGQIGFLVTYNFLVQILVDLAGVKYADKLGYKNCAILSHIFSVAGLVGLSFLPDVMPNPYIGLLMATTVYAAGGGMLEVVISPIVEALPTNGKSAAMSLLHSFYCWGQALVVALTTVFFAVAGRENWRYLALLWAIIPLGNIFLFWSAPVRQLSEDTPTLPMKKLLKQKLFWIFVLLMICSGASELAMSQWASFFAETGLQVDKSLGDLLGPCMFAILMGTSRAFYGVKGEKIPLRKYIVFSSILCIGSYLVAVFAPHPVLSLVGCAACGFSVGIMWPGVFSLAAKHCPQGGTTMFALLAFSGDIGCASGPSLVGSLSEIFGGDLKMGLLLAAIFPAVLIFGVFLLRKQLKKKRDFV